MSFFDVSRPYIADYGQASQQGMEIGQKMAQLQMLAKHGPGIAQGQQPALDALAMFDPTAAFNIKDTITQRGIQATERSRATAAQERAAFENMWKYMAQAQSPEEFDQIATSVSRIYPEASGLVGQFEQTRGVARLFAETPEVIDEMEALVAQLPPEQQEAARTAFIQNKLGLTPKAGDSEFERNIAHLPPEEQQRLRLARAQDMAGQSPPQWRAATPEEAARYGASAGQINDRTGEFKPGSGTATRAYGPNGELLFETGDSSTLTTSQDRTRGKAQGERIEAIKEQGFEAVSDLYSYDQLERDFAMLGPLLQGNPKADEISAAVQATLEPEQQRALARIRRFQTEEALNYVEDTKGAVTDREMAEFKAASPNLMNTREGNIALTRMIKSFAQRKVAYAEFISAAEDLGVGFDDARRAWTQWALQNPAFTYDGTGQVQIAPGGPETAVVSALRSTGWVSRNDPRVMPPDPRIPADRAAPQMSMPSRAVPEMSGARDPGQAPELGTVAEDQLRGQQADLAARAQEFAARTMARLAQIRQMSREELDALDRKALGPAEREAVASRYRELTASSSAP